MRLTRLFLLDLRQVILGFTLLLVLITLANQFVISYRVYTQQAMTQSLEANRAYAGKMADITSQFIQSLQMQLAYSAQSLSRDLDNPAHRKQEVQRLLAQTESFNSVVLIDHRGEVISAAPEQLGAVGLTLQSSEAKQSLRAQQPLMPQPFVSPLGNLVVSPSHPIFAEGEPKRYLGYIAGTIYLNGNNILSRLLGTHFHGAESRILVLSENGAVVYDNQRQHIGMTIGDVHPLWPAFMQAQAGESGAMISTKEEAQLIGYAPVKDMRWVVLVVSAQQQVVTSVGNTIGNLMKKAAPVTLITLLAIWLLAGTISAPLQLLARRVRDNDKTFSDIPAWYNEAKTLKRAIETYSNEQLQRISALNLASNTDPLTGIGNRRYMQACLDSMKEQGQAFAVLALDIDHFKKINDHFGHDIGDEVIKTLAQLLKLGCREYDSVCRSGGEEFMLLLPGLHVEKAQELAERLRQQIASHEFAPVAQVTVSVGVSLWQPGNEIGAALKAADNALYKAKHNGRNRTEVQWL
ncbi:MULTISPECIES: sensor domain-containing diguanylate cyclase [unclassified Pseudoalteromonas]|uniref:sensor domain-containing diguanylate cyclase n=1 Tax=unclassified Pseudoalteromonas TaxID=194690 RepID=UPI000CF734E2|nr:MULTISPECIES: sensor domain-containing diguanylate cyclase [unclassified Pseudoalteromonas]MBS3797913.1 GGDEF domain-containing protein [Pseudoalteromonas sp. BDTF-M6]